MTNHTLRKETDTHGIPRYVARFNTDAPRNSNGRDIAIKREAKRLGLTPKQLKLLHAEAHHKELDRRQGGPDAFWIAFDNPVSGRMAKDDHTEWHHQMQAHNIFMLRNGIMQYDDDKKIYFPGPELEQIYEKKIKERSQRQKGKSLATVGDAWQLAVA